MDKLPQQIIEELEELHEKEEILMDQLKNYINGNDLDDDLYADFEDEK